MTEKHGHTEVLKDFPIELSGKNNPDLLEVNGSGSVENFILLPQRAYRRMFPNNLTTDGLLKPDAFQSASHIILDSFTDGILPVHGTVILKVAH